MKKNYNKPSVALIEALLSQSLMAASGNGKELEGGGDSSQGIHIGGGGAPKRVGGIYI